MHNTPPNAILKQLDAAAAIAGPETARPGHRRSQSVNPRRVVYGILKAANRPLGAYEILRRMAAQTGRKIAPPTVYRALDFLIRRRLAFRIESQNAFIHTQRNRSNRSSIVLICRGCGSSTLLPDAGVGEIFLQHARTAGFEVDIPMIELQGTCADCCRGTSRTVARSMNEPIAPAD